jgi:hypothetical protein
VKHREEVEGADQIPSSLYPASLPGQRLFIPNFREEGDEGLS